MTQVYDADGSRVPVTLIEAVNSEVLMVRTQDKNGYDAVQIGIYDKKKKERILHRRNSLRKFALILKLSIKLEML